MLLSYFKIAWKVLQRRKFFTFISLFGISFTLMILLVVYAMYDHTVGPHTPERRVDRLLFVTHIGLWSPNSQGNSDPSYSFLNRYVRPLRTPEKISIATGGSYAVAYVGNTKLKLSLKGTDGVFWQVLDFDFLAGRPYSVQEVGTDAHVAVINESTARRYFGAVAGAVGRTIEADAVGYRVVGVVRDVPAARYLSTADIWIPLGLTVDVHEPNYFGNCMAILLAPSAEALPAMQEEFKQVMRHVPVQDPKEFTELRIYANTLLANTVRNFVSRNDDEPDDGVARFGRIAWGMALLFMLLPALNLVNLNVSRMLERSSEIGVRKAFGATAGRLVGQFLVENLFLTLVGGVLGLALAAGALALLNGSSVIEYAQFALNARVFAVALGAVLFFGLLSGVYPAYKMSKLPAIQALKGGTN
ncbi:ABC transporter permease [Hymenobacter caeli]|uniref:ABC transport system permease protein n=1 Tax=Hymenobacter caeli TaxID=2735894 RepID=A0ABX2FLD7_9BACT|nr:ABC transporter permease [Hymenobacter caeli]NRT17948.1 putative ABC transport system permease protein [Hymenobacter caeli]